MASTASKTKLVRPLQGGQITIPAEFRRELGIDAESVLRMTLVDGELRIARMPESSPDQGSETNAEWFEALYEYFAPARQEAVEKGYTDAEINAWIDEAVAEVRGARA